MPRSTRTALTGLTGTVLLATLLAGCGSPSTEAPTGAASAPGSSAKAQKPSGGRSSSTSTKPGAAPVSLAANVADHASKVQVDTLVKVKATDGTVAKVKLSYAGLDSRGSRVEGTVKGGLSEDGATWTADERLEPAATYTLKMTGRNAAEDTTSATTTFTTQKLSLDEQTFATVTPLPDSKVGVGMPVVLSFDVPVKDKAEFQRNLHVTSSPAQEGTWNWMSSREVHFRPKTYWKPGTKVSLDANLNGVRAGNGVYGQKSVRTSFTVGRSLITKVNLKTDQAKVYRDGKLVKTIPVTGGRPGWQSRSGTKLIMAKEYNKVMTNEMIGAKESYRLLAKYALRVTNSGEFLHAAPWSLGNLGVRNASHGCVGMSVSNAGWLYENSLIGDPVVTTGTSRSLEQGNGYADWNISFAQYAKGSAL